MSEAAATLPPVLQPPPPENEGADGGRRFQFKLKRSMLWLFLPAIALPTILYLLVSKGLDIGQGEENKKVAEKAKAERDSKIGERATDPKRQAMEEFSRAAQEQAELREKEGRSPAVPGGVPAPGSLPPPPGMLTDLAADTLRLRHLIDGRASAGVGLSDEEKQSTGTEVAGGNKGDSDRKTSFVLYTSSKKSGMGGSDAPLLDLRMEETRKAEARQQVKPSGGASAPPQAGNNGDISLLSPHNDKVKEEQVVTASRVTGTHWIAAGTVINAVTVNAVDTRIPGMLTARVTTPVFDSRYGRYEVIPVGSVLTGTVEAKMVPGQERAAVMFSSLITPAGGHVALNGARASDPQGRAGLEGEYHSLFWSRMGLAAMMAVGSMAMDKYENQSATTTTAQGATTTTQSGSAKIIGETAKKEIDMAYARMPYITMEAGQLVTIVTAGSIEIPPIANRR